MGIASVTIRFQCPACEVRVSLEALIPDVNWSLERLGDSVSTDEVEIECISCNEPFHVQIENSLSACTASIIGHPEVDVTAVVNSFAYSGHEEPEWLSLDSSPVPFLIFHDSSYRLGDILNELGEEGHDLLLGSSEVIRRMVFAAAISSMEAYLGDRLANAVFSHSDILKKVLLGDLELKKTSISLFEVQANPSIVKDKTSEYLAKILYHNLPKVNALYKLTLGVEIFPDDSIKNRLLRAIDMRHDIVHRNGKTTNGEQLTFPSDLVRETLRDVTDFVEYVETKTEVVLNELKRLRLLAKC